MKGHRKRLRERFVNSEERAFTYEALLELLLTYCIPQKDVEPLAKELVGKYGSIDNLLSVSYEALCSEKGLGEYSAVLLKLVNHLKNTDERKTLQIKKTDKLEQTEFFNAEESKKEMKSADEISPPEVEKKKPKINKKKPPAKEESKKPSMKMFNTALAEASLNLIPLSAEVSSYQEFQDLLRKKLPFNAEATRKRYANYVTGRFFPGGELSRDIVEISRQLKGKDAFKDVVFFIIFSKEPLAQHIAENVMWPSLAVGKVTRERIIEEIALIYPQKPTIVKSIQAIYDSYTNLNVAVRENMDLIVKERDFSVEAFNFILHRLFPEPGIYSFEDITQGPMTKWLLWSEKLILTQLYHLRELAVLSKVSDIDGIKQFTTKYDPCEAVIRLKQKL